MSERRRGDPHLSIPLSMILLRIRFFPADRPFAFAIGSAPVPSQPSNHRCHFPRLRQFMPGLGTVFRPSFHPSKRRTLDLFQEAFRKTRPLHHFQRLFRLDPTAGRIHVPRWHRKGGIGPPRKDGRREPHRTRRGAFVHGLALRVGTFPISGRLGCPTRDRSPPCTVELVWCGEHPLRGLEKGRVEVADRRSDGFRTQARNTRTRCFSQAQQR